MTSLDINSRNVIGDCKLKCSYSFDYQNSSTIAKNDGFSITLSYDKANVSPVIYNINKYEVESVKIYAPSIHDFNGSPTDAEIVIMHTPVVSGRSLAVAIPIILSTSSNNSKASTALSQIISITSLNAHAKGQSTTTNSSDFNLNDFVIPKIPLYAYTQSDSTNWIVFDKDNAILLEKSLIDTLTQIISPLPKSQRELMGPQLFYNKSGAVKGLSGGSNGQIYIDCQPVSESEEKVEFVKFKNPISFELNNSAIFIIQAIISCVIFIILLFGIYYGMKYLTKSSARVTTSKIIQTT